MGLLAIFSVSFRDPGFNNFKRQVLFTILALIIFFIVSRVNYGFCLNYSRLFYFGALFLMVAVLIFGKSIHGTTGWISYASFHIQPVEIMKLSTILILAKYFSKIRMDDRNIRHIVLSGIYCLIPISLALLQPDFGSAAVIAGIWIILLLFKGIKKKHAWFLFGLAIFIILLGWAFFLKPYQKDRIVSFLDLKKDPSGSGYHVIQSITAIGSGGIMGKGLGYGSQSQLKFLPEAHTDFIYSVIGEELGFIGSGILITAFIFLFWSIYETARKSIDNFGRFLAAGTLVFFFLQFVVNVGMNIGLVPVTGLPLPLVSYGGSALLVEAFLLGVVFSINSSSRKLGGYWRE